MAPRQEHISLDILMEAGEVGKQAFYDEVREAGSMVMGRNGINEDGRWWF